MICFDITKSVVKARMGSGTPGAQTKPLSVTWRVERRQLEEGERKQLLGCVLDISGWRPPWQSAHGEFCKVGPWDCISDNACCLLNAIGANGLFSWIPVHLLAPSSGPDLSPDLPVCMCTRTFP